MNAVSLTCTDPMKMGQVSGFRYPRNSHIGMFALRVALVFSFTGAFSLLISPANGHREPAQEKYATNATSSNHVFVFQDNFWVNLHHFLRAESRRRLRGVSLELPVETPPRDERTAWEAGLDAYTDLANRTLIFDESLVHIDNGLAAMPETATITPGTIEPKIAKALSGTAPIYRENRWDHDHLENQQWIGAYAASIEIYAPGIKARIGKVFQLTPPEGPILVDVVRDIGPTLAYTIAGPKGFAGHTFISPQANANPEVALDTILHEISHTMDAEITVVIDTVATQQHVTIAPDLWHAITLYTTHELLRRELGKQRDDTSYVPNVQFAKMFAEDGGQSILADLTKFWQPYLDGRGDLNDALVAVVSNAVRK